MSISMHIQADEGWRLVIGLFVSLKLTPRVAFIFQAFLDPPFPILPNCSSHHKQTDPYMPQPTQCRHCTFLTCCIPSLFIQNHLCELVSCILIASYILWRLCILLLSLLRNALTRVVGLHASSCRSTHMSLFASAGVLLWILQWTRSTSWDSVIGQQPSHTAPQESPVVWTVWTCMDSMMFATSAMLSCTGPCCPPRERTCSSRLVGCVITLTVDTLLVSTAPVHQQSGYAPLVSAVL